MGKREAMQDPIVVTGTFPLNNSYVCILFDSSIERSLVSHKLKHLINQNPHKLNETYIVEMDNGKRESPNDVYIGCTLTLNNHSFPISLMPVKCRSFDVIVGMNSFSPHNVEIRGHE